jgi:hypothetical protein
VPLLAPLSGMANLKNPYRPHADDEKLAMAATREDDPLSCISRGVAIFGSGFYYT